MMFGSHAPNRDMSSTPGGDHPREWQPFLHSSSPRLIVGPPLAEPVGSADHVRGASNALVTLVEYADFACLNCARAFPVLLTLVEQLRGTVRLVFRHYPLTWQHPGSALTARAAEAAARQGRFWEMHDELFRNPGHLHRDALHAHAASAGLDLSQFSRDLDDPSLAARIERDIASGRSSSVQSTPTFFIDGMRVAASRDLEALRDLVLEAAVRQTERLLRPPSGGER